MSYVIDRRLNGKNKSAVNRQRFMRRYRDHIKRAVTDAVSQRSITDMDRGENITIPNKDISEPRFSHGKGGERNIIQPGNQEFIAGDRIPRQSGGEGQGNQASNQGEGMDDFVFQISQAEFLEYMFEDLELPNLVKKHLIGIESFKMVHGGIIDEGLPSRINIIRSMRSAYGRRLALTGSSRRRIKLLQTEYDDLQEKEPKSDYDIKCLADLEKQINKLKSHIKKIPYIDDFDLKYNVRVKKPKPTSKAVMFCIMDVSGSMNQATKDIAKRFFILLYLFLKRNYEKTEVVFIRHHISAKEVDEHEFFYSRETGGTIVSSALKKMDEIIKERYPASEWNIYSAQASDGDNWNDDSPLCREILTERILPLVQYFAYIEITPRDHQALWREYEKILETHDETFALRQIVEINDIYPVFRDLFQRKYTK